MNDIMKIVQALKDSNILLKEVTKSIKNETKKKKRRIFKYVITLKSRIDGEGVE